eukprot:UN13235
MQKTYNIGYFESQEEAGKAVNAKCLELGLEIKNPSLPCTYAKPAKAKGTGRKSGKEFQK